MVKKRFQIQGMHCVNCVMAVENALEDLEGVKSASANYARQCVDVEYDETQLHETDITSAVAAAGYMASLNLDTGRDQKRRTR